MRARKQKAAISFLALIFLTGAATSFAQTPSVTVIEPSGSTATLPEGADFATSVLADPWDMDNAEDIAIPYCTGLNNPLFNNGIFSFQAAVNAPQLFLLYPGLSGSYSLDRGFKFPIDATKYEKLSIRMRVTGAGATDSMIVHWFRDSASLGGGTTNYGSTEPVDLADNGVWHTYEIDLTQPHFAGYMDWGGLIRGLRFTPVRFSSGANVEIDWIRLTHSSPGGSDLQVKWSSNLEGLSDLYLADASGTALQPIALGLHRNAGTHTYDWNSGHLPPGDYHVLAELMTDYARYARRDPFDMNQSGDIASTSGMMNESFAAGQYIATTEHLNPRITLDTYDEKERVSLNPAIFDKLYFRLWQSEAAPIYFFWSYAGTEFLVSDGVAGWATYSLDLSGNSTWKNGEIVNVVLAPGRKGGGGVEIKLDWVAITAQGQSFAKGTDLSDAPLEINTAPIMKILDPDDQGGRDYAASVLGNPWDMSQASDVKDMANMSNVQWTGNALVAQNSNNDPWIRLNSGNIDASYYHRVTYRMKVDGDRDIGAGSVARLLWINQTGQITTSDDLIVEEGWNNYTLDLRDVYIESGPAWGGTVNFFRLDPLEFPSTRTLRIDDVRLRADDEAFNGTFPLRWWDSDPDDNASITFYYDTNNVGFNGVAFGNAANIKEDPTGNSLLLNTAGIPDGLYYVYAVIDDGLNVNRYYASGPLRIHYAPPSDQQPPFTFNHYPPRNSFGVSPYTVISSKISDSGDGVDVDSIEMKINSFPVFSSITGQPACYSVRYRPFASFGTGQVVSVDLDASDLAVPANRMATDSYTLNISNGISTDGDALADDWQQATGLNSGFSAGDRGEDGDPDGDGKTNWEEYKYGTNPLTPASFVTAPGPGMESTVRVFDEDGQVTPVEFPAYNPPYSNGAQLAVGDVDGSHNQEIVTAPGRGNTSHIRIRYPDGQIRHNGFFAFKRSWQGGCSVAVGDVDGDGDDDIVVGALNGGGPQVRVYRYSGTRFKLYASFFGFDRTHRGGINVACGDVDGDGMDEIVCAVFSGARGHVKIFDGQGNYEGVEFFPFPATYKGGLQVACGNLVEDGREEIVVSRRAGASRIFAYRGDGSRVPSVDFFAFNTSYKHGVHISVSDMDFDGTGEIIVGSDDDSRSRVRIYRIDGTVYQNLTFFPYSDAVGARAVVGRFEW